MTQAWLTLTGVDGRDFAAPSEAQLSAVLDQLYAGRAPGARQAAADTEPASAALRFGYDDGLMYVAEISSDGECRFEEWSDRDCELALAAPRRMRASLAQAREVWNMMARRQVSRIRELPWQ
ncbi:MAG TPA: hypothetical protein VGC21_07095 [Telluria sp.]|jgi:hypothetical protein